MARTWLSVRVELLGGRGEELWPWPGRILAVAPSHTFLELAGAIDDAFARWDRSHLDLGDNWVHRCVVGERKIDPLDELGIVPDKPLPYWGWGSIPDQYGRRWDGDDGESPMPERPRMLHPMRALRWPSAAAAAELDIRAVRAAVAASDAGGFLDVLTGREIGHALQQLGSGVAMALRSLEGGYAESSRVYVDLVTGDAFSGGVTDPAIVGEDAAIDIDAEPDRWVWLERTGSRESWEDMQEFALLQSDRVLRDRLTRAIEGSGAFRRFRDVVRGEGLIAQWQIYSDDRRWGRARDALADAGIRVF